EPQSESDLRRVALAIRRGGRATVRSDARSSRVADGPRGLRGGDRRQGLQALGGRADWAPDARKLSSAPPLVRLPRIPQARPERPRLRRDAGLLRQAQLADRLTDYGGREARADLPRGRRLRRAARVLLRLRRQARGLAHVDAAPGAGRAAAGQ